MIYEVRSYQLEPNTVPEFIETFGKAYEHRKAESQISAFLFTEIGPLNQVIHIWPYEDAADRDRARAAGAKSDHWPPPVTHLQKHMTSEIFTPTPFTPTMASGKIGPVFEWRSYMIAPGKMPSMLERWGTAIEARMKLSPLAMSMFTEVGELNKFVHIWGYESLEHRREVRAEAVAKGIWPPKGGAGTLVEQENKICFPASFSPLQ